MVKNKILNEYQRKEGNDVMKLLFSDGNIQPVHTIQKTTAVVSGETLDAIVLQFTGTTLANVKSMFDDPAVLEQLTLYNDESEAVGDPFIGYINRIATSIVNESAGAYSVTLTRPASLITRVDSLTTAVEKLNTRVEAFDKQIGLYQDAHANTQNLIVSLTESLEGFQNAMQTADKTCRDAAELYVAKANSIDKIEPMLEGISNAYAAIQNTLSEINSQYGVITNDLAETKRAAGAAQSAADTAKINSDKCTSSANAALGRMDDVTKEYSDQGQKIEDVVNSVKNVSEKADKTASDLKTQAESVKDLDNKTKMIKNTVDSLIPETDITKMSLSDAKVYRVVESNEVLADFLEANPITSTCHNGVAAKYSITKDKQNYLQAMILTTQMAAQAGVAYQPSWNASGEPCTYDWTLEQLQQLAFEIESVVRPLVSAQQKIEAAINACNSIAELQAISIAYTITAPVTPTPVQPDPVEDTEHATEDTQGSTEDTEQTVEDTQESTEDTEQATEETQKSTEDTEAAGDTATE